MCNNSLLRSVFIFSCFNLLGIDAFCWGVRTSQRSVVQEGRKQASTSIGSIQRNLSREPSDSEVDPLHSFVEGQKFADREAEIEAMGGDPFFLMDDEDEEDVAEEVDDFQPSSLLSSMAMMSGGIEKVIGNTEERHTLDGMGPTPKNEEPVADDEDWEWDGTVDETAYFD